MSGFRSLSLRMGPIYCFVAKGRILVPCSTFSNLMLHRYIFKSRMPFSSDSLMDNYLLRRNLWAVFPDILNYADLALYISSSRRVAPLRLMPFSASPGLIWCFMGSTVFNTFRNWSPVRFPDLNGEINNNSNLPK